MQFVRPEIQTICMGQAASAAAVLLAAGTKGKRFALQNARILIHQPSSEGGARSRDIEIQAREILRMRALLEEMLARHTGQTVEKVRKDIERDKILTAEQAKEYGIVDEVITSRKLAPPTPDDWPVARGPRPARTDRDAAATGPRVDARGRAAARFAADSRRRAGNVRRRRRPTGVRRHSHAGRRRSVTSS